MRGQTGKAAKIMMAYEGKLSLLESDGTMTQLIHFSPSYPGRTEEGIV